MEKSTDIYTKWKRVRTVKDVIQLAVWGTTMKGLDESIVQWSFLGILPAVNKAYQIDGGRPRHSEAPI